jgi:hypothetical protein
VSEEILVKVKKSYLAKSSKDTPSIKIVLDAPNETLYFDAWLTDGTIKQTIKVMRDVLGWKGTNLSDINGTDTLVGVECCAVIEEEEYNGKSQRKVKFLNSLGGGSSIAPDKVDEMQTFFNTALSKYENAKPVDVDLPF